MLIYLLASAVSVAGALTFPASIQAEPINFRATLLVSCIIVVTDGALAPNGDYTLLSSENTGGLPATATVTALGGAPRLTFTAPTITSSADVTGVTPQIRYVSPGGANQPYTSSQTTYNQSGLLGTYTVNAQASKPTGFNVGTYTIGTVLTCSG